MKNPFTKLGLAHMLHLPVAVNSTSECSRGLVVLLQCLPDIIGPPSDISLHQAMGKSREQALQTVRSLSAVCRALRVATRPWFSVDFLAETVHCGAEGYCPEGAGIKQQDLVSAAIELSKREWHARVVQRLSRESAVGGAGSGDQQGHLRGLEIVARGSECLPEHAMRNVTSGLLTRDVPLCAPCTQILAETPGLRHLTIWTHYSDFNAIFPAVLRIESLEYLALKYPRDPFDHIGRNTVRPAPQVLCHKLHTLIITGTSLPFVGFGGREPSLLDALRSLPEGALASVKVFGYGQIWDPPGCLLVPIHRLCPAVEVIMSYHGKFDGINLGKHDVEFVRELTVVLPRFVALKELRIVLRPGCGKEPMQRLHQLLTTVHQLALIRIASQVGRNPLRRLKRGCMSVDTADPEWMFPAELEDRKIGDMQWQGITYRKDPQSSPRDAAQSREPAAKGAVVR